MLTIHHLYDSRSERLLYGASALSNPHQVKAYPRDAKTGLARIHGTEFIRGSLAG